MSTGGDPKSSQMLIAGLIGVVFMIAAVLVAQLLFYGAQRMEDERKLIAPQPQELVALQTEQLAHINTTRHVNEQDGLVAIPIDRAIDLYVTRMKAAPAPTTMPTPGPDQKRPQPGEVP